VVEGPPPGVQRILLEALSLTGYSASSLDLRAKPGAPQKAPPKRGPVHDGATPGWALGLVVVDPDFLVHPAGAEIEGGAAAVALDPFAGSFHEVVEERNERAAIVV